jgi:hypothetical protein
VPDTVEQPGWTPALEGRAIALLGSFNPAIFQPAWFAEKGLIRAGESEQATEVIVTHEVSQFSTEWLQFQVTRERLAATTSDPSRYGSLKDLLVGTFTLLEHTPFSKMGLNDLAHYAMPSQERWHAFGDYLAPKDPWREYFVDRIGMRSLTIEAKRPGSSAKFLRAKIEPSLKVQHGVFFEINEHYETEERPGSSRVFLDILAAAWDEAGIFARHLQKALLSQKY